MIFGFGRKRKELEEEAAERELVIFQGALNGTDVNLKENARLAQAGLPRAKELISDALDRRADMVRVEPKGERASISFSVDGMASQGPRLAKREALAVTQMLKLLSGLDVRKRTKPQSGGLKAEFGGEPYELLIDSSPVPGGERLMVRARNLKARLSTPDELNFSPEIKAKIRAMSSTKRGVMLVCGGPRTGTTTAAFAILRGIDPYLLSVYSLADPGSYELVNVPVFEATEGETFADTLDRCLRSEADVIFLEPFAEAQTAKIAFGAHERSAMLAEFRAKDAANGIVQISRLLGDPKLASAGLSGVFSQKLVRTLCESCKQAYRPNKKLLAKAGLPEETEVLYRPPKPPGPNDEEAEPCSKCRGRGFQGRTGMMELIEMTDAMRALVAKTPDVAAIKKLQKQESMQTLQKDGLRLVLEGKTSMDELQRVFKAS